MVLTPVFASFSTIIPRCCHLFLPAFRRLLDGSVLYLRQHFDDYCTVLKPIFSMFSSFIPWFWPVSYAAFRCLFHGLNSVGPPATYITFHSVAVHCVHSAVNIYTFLTLNGISANFLQLFCLRYSILSRLLRSIYLC
jgi:hypothetical protein